MNREIKYRAWLYHEKKYVYVLAIHFAEIGELTTIDYIEDGKMKIEFELEQDTGFKDKNGKRIYEGDIVDKAYHNIETYDKNGVVEMGYLCDSDGYNNGEIYGWKAGDSSLADVCDECEVIGNIHENPELLGGKE